MTLRKHFVTRFAITLLIASVACVKHGKPTLAIEECDPAGYIPCVQAAGFVSLPIADSNLFLTYSSRWMPGSRGEPDWDARSLGLGGWSINAVERYDNTTGRLISGDGSWRLVDATKLPSGEMAVPSFDGSVAYVFDSAGRHIRTVDGRLGTDLIRISYDSIGRLSSIEGSANGQPLRISVQRDSRGVAHALSGIDGGATTLALDDNGHLSSVTDPAGNTTRITWNDAGLVQSLTDPTEAVTHFTYDGSHRLATTTDPDGIVQTFQTQTSGDSFEIRVSTKLGRHWFYRAESTRGGVRRTFTSPDGTTSSETIGSNGIRKIEFGDGTLFQIGAVPNPVWHGSTGLDPGSTDSS
jgi:YD repeat-containing protein